MSKKIRDLFVSLLQGRTATLGHKSLDVVNSFTAMIERLTQINEEVDKQIADANEAKAKIEQATEELEKTKAHNEAIRAKIESIIS